MGRLVFAASLLCCTLLASCTTVFVDDFEHDNVGQLPVDPPKAPKNSVLPLGTSLRVSGADPLAGGKSLKIGGGSDKPTIYFVSSKLSGKRDVYFSWRHRIDAGISRVSISGGHFETYLDLVVTQQTVVVQADDRALLVKEGLHGGMHDIYVRLNPATGSYKVSVDSLTDAGLTGTAPKVASEGNLQIAFQQPNAAPVPNTFTIDNVQISERNPD